MWLRLDRVSKTYHGGENPVPALCEVSLEIDTGMFVAIRGPSGCGKTTLLLTAGTLLAPDSGDVVMGGERPYQMTGDARASFRGLQLGFVFQQFHLVPYLSVLDNVLAPTLALAQSSSAVDPRDARERALGLLEQFGLADRAGHTPSRLSSGERQRCAMARALLNQPKMLLADEPTGNLDPENADQVLGALRQFVTLGGAVLLVTHDNRAAAAADKTWWMNRGVLSQSPQPETVTAT
ncbi:MAG: ABC transporter ATP-binding protein [Planctomycetaceae bacterium]|nr:MAG: ABC transporter ATP-binding protein [Planctomycetaceae bacterium]